MSERISAANLSIPGPPPAKPPTPVASAEPGRFAQLLEGFSGEVDRGERMVRGALGGAGALGAGDLIALQAGIYRYSEAVDLAGKLVDRASSSLRTVLQSGG